MESLGELGELAQHGRRGLLGQVHADAGGRHDRGEVGLEAGRGQPVPPSLAPLEVDRHKPQPAGDADAQLHETATLPRLGAGLVDLEDPQAVAELGPALGEGVQAGTEDDELGDAGVGLLGHQVLD